MLETASTPGSTPHSPVFISRSSLERRMLYWGGISFTTARRSCARDVCCEKRFPKRLRNNLARRAGKPFVLKSKAQIISTVVEYHSSLETAGKLTKPARDREYPW